MTLTAPCNSPHPPMSMDHAVFVEFGQLIYDRSGIRLKPGKETMLAARIGKRMQQLGLLKHEDYLGLLRRDAGGEEIIKLLDTVSTNVTSFFREGHHFEVLAEAMAGWMREGQGRFRIWSAASSTGQEPYSIAMTILETAGARPMDVKILATDISTRVLGIARAGIYQEQDMKGVPNGLRGKYFDWDRSARTFTVRPEVRRLVTYHRFNLSEVPFPMRGPMDTVFCRNVMIYFDKRVRVRLIGEIRRLLREGGYFMLGHAESLSADGSMGFEHVAASCFIKK